MLIKQDELLKNPGQRCYYVVKKAEPIMDDKLQEGAIYAERVFRGARVPGLVFVEENSWHTDWQLVPKHEESFYRIPEEQLLEHGHPDTVVVLPRWMEVPPLMDVFLRRQIKMRGGITIQPVKLDTPLLNIRMHYEFSRLNQPHQVHRIAEENEESKLTINRPMKSLLKEQFRPTRENIRKYLSEHTYETEYMKRQSMKS